MDISPDIETRLRYKAATRGLSVEEYLRVLLDRDNPAQSVGRDYTSSEIVEMLEADKLPPDLQQKVKRLKGQ